ncbi:MAG: hypothetical protein IPJ40_01750 [Saprospirales bacterium]|nr:hypothetical protein [Saprospirales bacterium]
MFYFALEPYLDTAPGATIIGFNGLSIDVIWGNTGGEVCASFPTTCGPNFEICLAVEVLPPTILTDTAYICNGDVYEAYGETFYQPGVYNIILDPSTIVQLVLLPDLINCFILPPDTLSPGAATYLLDYILIGDPTHTQLLWEGPGISGVSSNVPNPEISLPGWYTPDRDGYHFAMCFHLFHRSMVPEYQLHRLPVAHPLFGFPEWRTFVLRLQPPALLLFYRRLYGRYPLRRHPRQRTMVPVSGL